MDRLWNRVDKSGECWIWLGGKDSGGYGQIKFMGKTMKTHRVAYYLTHGEFPVITRHTCDNPPCVNPEHLVSGTHGENNRDIMERERREACLSNEQVLEIRKLDYSDSVLEFVSQKYNISLQNARNILTGKTYIHLPGGQSLPRQKSKRKLTEAQVEEIRQAVSRTYWGQQQTLAKMYGVSRNVIQRIQYGTY